MAAPKLEPVRDRDYRAEMREVIDAETTGNYVSAVVAEHVVKKLAVTDPDLLNGWLYANAAFFIRHMINLRDSATRTSARTQARRLEFAAAAGQFENGDPGPLKTSFLGLVHVVEDGSRKKLADLTAADLDHVATDYETRAAENAMHATFLRALAKKIGRKTVGQVYDEKKLAEMWLSIAGS